MSDDQRVIATPESCLTAGVTYEGKTSHIGDEPINTLLACGNMGPERAPWGLFVVMPSIGGAENAA